MAPFRNSDITPLHNPSPASQFEDPSLLRTHDHPVVRDIGTSTQYKPGQSSWNPKDIHNVGFFVLFALLGLAFVVSAIWFFFWAKNGGFHFRKGDWDEYKSTVLRRKGPDGKTLSNATKSTKLGGGSVVGSEYTDTSFASYRDSERGGATTEAGTERGDNDEEERRRRKKRRHKKANRYDADVRQYRSEKPARVGGINKAPDSQGTVLDYSTAASNLSGSQPAMSEFSAATAPSPSARRQHSASQHRAPKRDFSFNHGSEASFSVTASDMSSNAPLRQPHRNQAQSSRHHARDIVEEEEEDERRSKRAPSSAQHPKQYQSNRARRSQGFYAGRASQGSYHEPINFQDDARSRAGSSMPSEMQLQNTKSYKHTIPGLSKGPVGAGTGFRRGGGGRRDSLSDSDGDQTYMS